MNKRSFLRFFVALPFIGLAPVVKAKSHLEELLEFFHNCRGKCAGWRFKEEWGPSIPWEPKRVVGRPFQEGDVYFYRYENSLAVDAVASPVPVMRIWRNGELIYSGKPR